MKSNIQRELEGYFETHHDKFGLKSYSMHVDKRPDGVYRFWAYVHFLNDETTLGFGDTPEDALKDALHKKDETTLAEKAVS